MVEFELRSPPLCLLSKSEEATDALAQWLGERASRGLLLTLDGDLGTGKTLFVKGFARGLEVDEHVDSPTYTLMNEYQGRCHLYHCDAWMLGREEAFLLEGGQECLNGEGVTVIEWGSRVAQMLPRPYLAIQMSHLSVDSRKIEIRVVTAGGAAPGPPALEMRQLLKSLQTAPIHPQLRSEMPPELP